MNCYPQLGTEKKLVKAVKTREGRAIGPWIASIKSHLYWLVASSGHNQELKKAKWLSLLNHISDKHTGHSQEFPNCFHGDLQQERQWLKKGKRCNFYILTVGDIAIREVMQ